MNKQSTKYINSIPLLDGTKHEGAYRLALAVGSCTAAIAIGITAIMTTVWALEAFPPYNKENTPTIATNTPKIIETNYSQK